MNVEFPTDSNAATLDQQYMFGDQLLVAPVTTQGATSQNVYVRPESGTTSGMAAATPAPAPRATAPRWEHTAMSAPARYPPEPQRELPLGGTINNSVTSYTNRPSRVYPSGTSSYDWYTTPTTTRTIGSTVDWSAYRGTVTVPVMPTASTVEVIASQPSSVTRNGTTLTNTAPLLDFRAPARAGTGIPYSRPR